MAGTTRYQAAKQLLENYKNKEFFLEDLKGIIRRYLSGNEKTIIEYLFLMRSTGLIQEKFINGYSKWEICQEQTTKKEQIKNGE